MWLYVIWAIFIAILTLLPSNLLPNIRYHFTGIDKIVHIILFSILTILGLSAIKSRGFLFFRPYTQLTSAVAAIGYGYLLEIIQIYIPQRSYDNADFVADIVGTIVGYGLFLGISKISSQNNKKY